MTDEQIIAAIDAATRNVYALDPVARHFGLSVGPRVPYLLLTEADFPEDTTVLWRHESYVILKRFNKIIAGTVMAWYSEENNAS